MLFDVWNLWLPMLILKSIMPRSFKRHHVTIFNKLTSQKSDNRLRQSVNSYLTRWCLKRACLLGVSISAAALPLASVWWSPEESERKDTSLHPLTILHQLLDFHHSTQQQTTASLALHQLLVDNRQLRVEMERALFQLNHKRLERHHNVPPHYECCRKIVAACGVIRSGQISTSWLPHTSQML